MTGLSKGPAWILAFIAGALIALGQAPFNFPWIVFAAIPVLYLLICERPARGAFGIGMIAGTGYFATSLHWIVEPFLVDMARTGWMAPFALILLAMGLALFWGVPFALSRVFRSDGLAALLGFAALWALGDYTRSMVLTGFPWALMGHVWLETPVAQMVSLFGAHGLGLVTIVLSVLWLHHMRLGILVLGVLAAMWGFGVWRVPVTIQFHDTVVRLVQPNAPQHLKWHPEHVRRFFDRQVEATSAVGSVDMVIWPEASVPFLIDTRPDIFEALSQRAPDGAKIMVGGNRKVVADGEERWLNSAALIGEGGAIDAVYDKHHLVPFGEYLPFPDLFEAFGLQALAQNARRFSSAAGPQRIDPTVAPAFQPLICYEVIFAHEILRGDARPEWLLQMTNDAWFGAFSGPYQHLAQARLRSIEFGLPLARAANTGVSAMIDPFGRITEQLGLDVDGFIDVALPKALPETVYSKTGDWPFLVVAAGMIAGCVVSRSRRRANLSQNK